MNMFIKPLTVREAEKKLQDAETYQEWARAAKWHDQLSGMEDWKKSEKSELYDYQMVKARLAHLRRCRETGDDRALLFMLNEGIHGNLGRMGKTSLYTKAKFGTKKQIQEYIDEVTDALHYLANLDTPEISFEEKLDFFNRASHCFGRTALMLSGGAALGNFHLGVIKTLIEQDLMPKVISGASAGSIFAGMVGTNSHGRLKEMFKVENLITAAKEEASLLKRLWSSGYRKLERDDVISMINRYIPDLTFEEAYKLTGHYINITVSPNEPLQEARLLNAIASPNVLVRTAVMASCAVPGVFPPVTLMAKDKDGSIKPYLPTRKWVDGSFSDDLPAKRLARMYGVNHYIVSLTNPFILPFASDPANASDGRKIVMRLFKVGMKEYSRILGIWNRRLFKKVPRLESLFSLYFSVVGQNYTGDINIIYRSHFKDPRRLLTLLTPEEMLEMIKQGQRSTWPKVEAIRTTTKIGLALDKILEDYAEKELQLAKEGIQKRRQEAETA